MTASDETSAEKAKKVKVPKVRQNTGKSSRSASSDSTNSSSGKSTTVSQRTSDDVIELPLVPDDITSEDSISSDLNALSPSFVVVTPVGNQESDKKPYCTIYDFAGNAHPVFLPLPSSASQWLEAHFDAEKQCFDSVEEIVPTRLRYIPKGLIAFADSSTGNVCPDSKGQGFHNCGWEKNKS